MTRRRRFHWKTFLIGWLTGRFGFARLVFGVLSVLWFLGWLLTHTTAGVLLLAAVGVWAWWRYGPRLQAARTPALEQPTALYRYATFTQVAYIGITSDPERRHEQHVDDGRWFATDPRVHRSLEWFPTRAAALLAEQQAIRTERPTDNIVHNSGNRPYGGWAA